MASPGTLNRCLDGTLVGGEARYMRATVAKFGKRGLFCRRHSNRWSVLAVIGSERYCASSVSVLWMPDGVQLIRIAQFSPYNPTQLNSLGMVSLAVVLDCQN